MRYPSHILPSSNKKCIEANLKSHYLIRHVPVGEERSIWDQDTGTINFRYVCSPRENIYDLSSSLFEIFKEDNCYIELTDSGKTKFNDYCDCDEKIQQYPQYLKDFLFNENRGWFFLKMDDLEGLKVQYKNQQNGQKFIAAPEIVHSPMRWNFWHFSVRWEIKYPEGGRLTKNMKKKLATEARASIAQFCQKELAGTPDITENMYLK